MQRIARIAQLLAVVSLLMMGVVATTTAAAAAPKQTASCNPERDLSGEIDPSGTTGTVVNASTTCTYDVGIASYEVYDFLTNGKADVLSQQIIDYTTTTIGPSGQLTLDVDVRDCATQVDLFYGHVVLNFAAERYTPRLLDAMVTDPSNPCVDERRMTGGGSVFTQGNKRVTHGFQIRCNEDDNRQNLQINWGGGSKFHLLDMTMARCYDSPSISPNNPVAPFDTYEGWGTGRFNGVEGATIYFVFTDAGEPGTKDTAYIEVKDANGNVVLSVATNTLKKGNQQAHK